MALKSLNTVGGLSVGWQASNVILSNADVNPNNLTVTATATLGNISNVRIFGGSEGQVLRTDGAGNLSWISGAAGSPGGSNTQIQFNDGGAFNAVSNFTYNKTTNLLNVNGNVVVGDNTNNVSLFSSGAISTTGNLTAANINTGGVLSVTGNANVGNIGATTGVFTNISGTLTTASQTNITAVGTLSSLSVTGNANIGNIGATNGAFTNVSGNGSALTNLPAGNIVGQVANALVAGTVYTNAQPNITSVGTLSSLSVSGNANVGNLGVTGIFATTLSATGNANVGNIGVSGLVTVTGNVTAANFIGTFIGNATGIANGNSNISIPTAGGNILFATNGTANRMVISTTGNVGIGTNNPAYELEVVGTLAATSKSFLIDHPTKEGWKLQYGSLESPYHGVRLTGEAAVINGYCKIDLPNYIYGLVKQEGAQVQITNKQHGKVLWVEEINVDQNYLIIKSDEYQDQELKFYWSFTAIRKDISDLVVELGTE